MTKPVPHPAKYTDSFLPIFESILTKYNCKRVIDNMAGTGKFGYIKDYGFKGEIYLNEIEPEWACQSPRWCKITIGDAAYLPYDDNFFDGACTSPVYGNRMSDHHNARDDSRRNTYTHTLGRKLTEGNTGAMQWSSKKQKLRYCAKHKEIWTELKRVLCDGAIFILNISDHMRKGKRVRVTLWHILCLKSLGFELLEHHKIPTPRLRFGANSDKRVEYESILVFRLNKKVTKNT